MSDPKQHPENRVQVADNLHQHTGILVALGARVKALETETLWLRIITVLCFTAAVWAIAKSYSLGGPGCGH